MRRSNFDFDIPPVPPRYQSINRYRDPHSGWVTAKLIPGQLYVCDGSELMTAVTGACLTVCASDAVVGCGGMAQFLLSSAERMLPGATAYDPGHRRAFFMLERLVSELTRFGAVRSRIRVKLFGAAAVEPEFADACQATVRIARDYMRSEGIIADRSDLGLLQPRKIMFFPSTGKVMVKRLGALRNDTLLEREREYLAQIQAETQERKDRPR